MVRILHLNLKGIYWDAIKKGEKKVEYRVRNYYWSKRLERREYDLIRLCRGYPRRGDDSKIIYRKWNGYRTGLLKHAEFGDEEVLVYLIDVSEEADLP